MACAVVVSKLIGRESNTISARDAPMRKGRSAVEFFFIIDLSGFKPLRTFFYVTETDAQFDEIGVRIFRLCGIFFWFCIMCVFFALIG